jgi:hypothetical protein
VRQWSHVFDATNLHAKRLQAGDRTFTTRTWALDANFQFPNAKLRRTLGTGLRGSLSCERSTLAASLETNRTSCCPAQNVAVRVCDCDRRVVERRFDVRDTASHISANASLLTLVPFLTFQTAQNESNLNDQCFMSLTPFLPATVFFTPLRVRAFVRVR